MRTVSHGVASQYFIRLSNGDTFTFRGPAGRFVLRSGERDKIFLATGTGIAPIRSQLQSFFHDHAYTPLSGRLPTMRLLWGVKTVQDAYFADEFVRLEKSHPQFSFTICLSQQTSVEGLDQNCFSKGRITDMFDHDKLVSDVDYYICGAPAVVAAVSVWLTERGIDTKNIFFEKF